MPNYRFFKPLINLKLELLLSTVIFWIKNKNTNISGIARRVLAHFEIFSYLKILPDFDDILQPKKHGKKVDSLT